MDIRATAGGPIAVIIAIAAFALPAPGLAACSVHSGQKTAALVELYTSEGCSSCPPADRALGQLNRTLGPPAEVFALALHVDYWDAIGWKDPYAQGIFTERHRWLVQANHHTVVYTPHFFVSGTELSSRAEQLRDVVGRVNATPAAAEIELQAKLAPDGVLSLQASAKVLDRSDPTALYLALAESGLVSKVTSGENGGTTLTHDHVVRTWIGPIELGNGEARAHRELALPAAANRLRLEVIAFVADERTGKVLQAVGTQACPLIEAPISGAREHPAPGSQEPRISTVSNRSPAGNG